MREAEIGPGERWLAGPQGLEVLHGAQQPHRDRSSASRRPAAPPRPQQFQLTRNTSSFGKDIVQVFAIIQIHLPIVFRSHRHLLEQARRDQPREADGAEPELAAAGGRQQFVCIGVPEIDDGMIPVFAVKRLQEIGQDGFETADVREIVPGRFQVDYRNQVPGMGLQASVEVLELRPAGTMGTEVMIEADLHHICKLLL